ncbi:hypothetical protein FOA43_000013 [Brettanomyces nanus]|uniref:WD40 repeat-like protein n=1 Tax=Eeniella nana TaxID=13502 RepID=A0A875RXU3_EENNA|nr:uncharacterized protein FOA43_000013 [Brettanomyces nanus]QPG72712.1 hypothetical protein FOA43_000013 [Brettanomyces nanus]
MYLPPDLSRYSRQTPQQFMQMLNSTILPLQTTDPNCIFRLKEEEFEFDLLDATFKPDMALRVSRTPLLSTDPRTYASLSKFIEYNLRKYHSTLANANQNQLIRPLGLPPDLTGVQAESKTEVLPLGCSINPLSSDPFKNVHLTPGFLCAIVDYAVVEEWQSRVEKQRHAGSPAATSKSSHSASSKNAESSGLPGMLFGKSRQNSKTLPDRSLHSLKSPQTVISRNSSSFIDRVVTGDNFNKKFANNGKLLIGCNGRAINMIVLDNSPKHIEVDPPALKMNASSSVITCLDTFPHIGSDGERSLDVLVGFGSGDLLWLDPIIQKYTRWNKRGWLKEGPVMSVEWSKCGSFAMVGFADGDVLIFSRDLEDDESYGDTPKTLVYKDRYMRTYRTLMTEGDNRRKRNPIAHYKFSRKAIVDITTHPLYHNIVAMACDDGYLRIFDLLKERITDIQESYYGGFLSVSFTEDGKYLLAGGEDDLVSIYEFQGISKFTPASSGLIKLVARLEGSKSWVRDITVDRHRSKSGILYRIGTAGDDGVLRFYEFQPRNLPKVKKIARKTAISTSSAVRALPLKVSVSNSMPAKATAMRRALTSKHGKNTESISSLTSSNTNRRLSLLEMISHGSATSLQQLQQQQETNLEDKCVKANYIFSDHKLPCLKTDSGTLGSHFHISVGLKECPIIFPICEKDVKLGRLSGLYFEKDYVWAFVATGDSVRWKRP